jgi:hypothetical protein
MLNKIMGILLVIALACISLLPNLIPHTAKGDTVYTTVHVYVATTSGSGLFETVKAARSGYDPGVDSRNSVFASLHGQSAADYRYTGSSEGLGINLEVLAPDYENMYIARQVLRFDTHTALSSYSSLPGFEVLSAKVVDSTLDDTAFTTDNCAVLTYSSSITGNSVNDYGYILGGTVVGQIYAGDTYWEFNVDNSSYVNTSADSCFGLMRSNDYDDQSPADEIAALYTVNTWYMDISIRYLVDVPAVTTNDATSITSTSGNINGELTSMGDESEIYVYFGWGTENATDIYSWANNAWPGDTGDGAPPMTSTGTFTFPLTGLTVGVPIYYQAIILYYNDSDEEVDIGGEVKSFTPTEAPDAGCSDGMYRISGTTPSTALVIGWEAGIFLLGVLFFILMWIYTMYKLFHRKSPDDIYGGY